MREGCRSAESGCGLVSLRRGIPRLRQLDAIEAISVARAFAYNGGRGRAMHGPDAPTRESRTEAEYRASESTTISPFHEKLFKRKSLMNTAEGKRRAEDRDLYMRGFLNQFRVEWDCEA